MKITNMLQCFCAGDQISGYCNGLFGRDDYKDKICVLVRPGYAIFEYTDENEATVLNFREEDVEYYNSDNWKNDTCDY